uniref:EMB2761 (EMBRYO DEFECTIVE 2761) n=1 Tax=Arundo donax TaxID=35708 RepID=A0A0A9G729_ARUDO
MIDPFGCQKTKPPPASSCIENRSRSWPSRR